MDKAGKRQNIRGAATLMIKAECVGTGKRGSNAVVDEESIRNSKSGNLQPVFARSFEIAKVGFEDALIAGEGKAFVGSPREAALMSNFAACRLKQVKSGKLASPRGVPQIQFTEAAQVVTDHGLFREAGKITDLIDVDGRAPPFRVGRGHKAEFGWPERGAWVFHFDGLIFGNRTGELEIEVIANAQVSVFKRRIQYAPSESHRLHWNGLITRFDGKFLHIRQMKLPIGIGKIPAVHWRGIGRLCRDEGEFQDAR